MVTRFITNTGIEVAGITTAQMREVDRVAVEETGPSLLQMMENAGRSLALTSMESLGTGWNTAEIVVLAGTAGNGGGGICTGRHLANRGARTTVVITDPDHLGRAASRQCAVYSGTPGRTALERELGGITADLVVDAMIGYGLTGPPRGPARAMIEWANGTSAPAISLDVPSGVESTDGERPGAYIAPAVTLTLALPKTGLGGGAVGELVLADIGIPQATYGRVGLEYSDPFGAGYRVAIQPMSSRRR